MSFQAGNVDLGVAFVGDLSDLQRKMGQAAGDVEGFGRKAQGSLRGVTTETGRLDDGMQRLANGIKGAFVGGSVAVGLIALKNNMMAATSAIIDAQVQVDRLRNGFAFGAGGMEAGAREMAFVREEVTRLGLELNGTASQYMKMVAASRGNAMQGAQTRALFTSIAEASVVMGMGVEQSERAFMAVVQMMSKGKVMAEELRGQLGEHLPGAFSIAARAMGVTEVELNKLMETGNVLAGDFLPKFAAQLRKELAGSVEQSTLSMQANLNRLSTAWLNFKQQFAQSGAGSAIAGEVKGMAYELQVLGDIMEVSRQRGDGFWATIANTGGAAIGRASFGALELGFETFNGAINLATFGLTNFSTELDLMPDNLRANNVQLQLTAEKIKQAEQEYGVLAERLSMAPDNIYIKSELNNLARYIIALRAAQDEQRALAGGGGAPSGPIGSVGSGDAALARAQRADYDRRKTALDGFMGKYATDGEKMAQEMQKQKDLLGDLYSPEVEARIREHYIKPVRGASAATKAAKEAEKERSEAAEREAGFRQKVIEAELRWTIDGAKASNEAFDEYFEGQEKNRLAGEARIKAGREMLENIEFETSLMGMNTQEREVATAMRELERAGVVKGTEAYEHYAEAIRRGVVKRAEMDKSLAFWREVESTAESVFMDLAMNGQDAFKRIGESIQREVIQLLYEMTVKRWIIQIAGSFGADMGGAAGSSVMNMMASAAMKYVASAASTTAVGSYAATASGYTYGTGLASQQSLALAAQEYGMTSAASSAAASEAAATAAASSEVAAASAATAATEASAATAATTATEVSAAGAGTGTTSAAAYAGWAALIVAAVVAAENVYSAGYNRQALSSGGIDQQRFGNNSYTSGQGYGESDIYNNSLEKLGRNAMDFVGMSEKWADILSGTSRMATLFGRKLKAYGYEIEIAAGNVAVSGYEFHKGGLFRSNKTIPTQVDPGDAQAVTAMVQDTRAAAIDMAQSLGLSTAAIEAYTGELKINMKVGDDAADAQRRYGEAFGKLYDDMLKEAQRATFDEKMAAQVDQLRDSASHMAAAMGLGTAGIDTFTGSLGVTMAQMDGSAGAADLLAKASEDLHWQMLQAADGFTMTREQFAKFLEGVNAEMERYVSASSITDTLVAGMTGRMDAAQVGESLSETIIGGIYNSLATPFAQQIGQVFSSQILTPVFTAIMSGVPISQALSQQAISNVVATAQAAAGALNAIVQNAEFQAAISGIQAAISGVSGAVGSVRMPRYKAPTPPAVSAAASNAVNDRQKLEEQLWGLLGLTNKLRARELSTLSAANQALQKRIWALEDAKDGMDSAYDALERAADAERKRLDELLGTAQEAEQALNSVFSTLRDNIKDLRGEAETTTLMQAEQARTLLAQARYTGNIPDNEKLADLIESARAGLDAQRYTSAAERDRARLLLAGELDALASVVQPQLSAAEQSVVLLESQIEALDAQLELAKGQMDALNGIDTSVQSVAAAVTALGTAMASYAGQLAANGVVRQYASGGVFTNGIVTSPTYFHNSQMGEAGAEAIMPLTNIGGSLGVRAVGGGSDPETKALLRQLLAEMQAARLAGEAGAVAANRMDARLKKVIRAEDGADRLMMGTPGNVALPVEVAA